MTINHHAGPGLLARLSLWSARKFGNGLGRPAAETPVPLSPEFQAAILAPRRSQTGTGNWPATYRATPRQDAGARHPVSPELAALRNTRFHVDWAEDALLAFLGRDRVPFSVLDMPLRGFEQCWHSDLRQALDLRAAIASRIQVHLAGGLAEFDHLVVPTPTPQGLTLHGWFNHLTGRLPACMPWAETRSGRMRRGRPVIVELPKRMPPQRPPRRAFDT